MAIISSQYIRVTFRTSPPLMQEQQNGRECLLLKLIIALEMAVEIFLP